jgi:hypothetical protein
MSTIGKCIGLGTAFLVGIAIAANAGPSGRADASTSATIANPPSSSTPLGSGQPPRRELAALPPANPAPAPNSVTPPQVTVFGFKFDPGPYSRSGVGPRVSSFGTVRTEHYQAPEDFDANVAMHPYKRGVCPWPGP